MDAGPPDPHLPAEPSLVQRLSARIRARRTEAHGSQPRSTGAGILLGALIASGPLLTIAGARVLASYNRTEAAALEVRLAPRIAASQSAATARREMAVVIGRPTLATTVDALARALPPGATLVRAERTGAGALALEVATADPDALRAALRRAPAFARLRNVGQRQGDAAMIVTFEGAR